MRMTAFPTPDVTRGVGGTQSQDVLSGVQMGELDGKRLLARIHDAVIGQDIVPILSVQRGLRAPQGRRAVLREKLHLRGGAGNRLL